MNSSTRSVVSTLFALILGVFCFPIPTSALILKPELGTRGIQVQDIPNSVSSGYSAIITDGGTGVIMAWVNNSNVYAQKYDINGNTQWGASPGVSIANVANTGTTGIVMIPDGSGGAFITWRQGNDSVNLYAQHIDDDGNLLWGANGTLVCDPPAGGAYNAFVYFHVIETDGAGGLYLSWYDNREASNNYATFAQRLNSSGVAQWTANGVTVDSGAGNQTISNIVKDGTGGVLLQYFDSGLRFQRLNSTGTLVLGAGGIAVDFGSLPDPDINTMISDEAGNAIAAIVDYTEGHMYLQKYEPDGDPIWNSGEPILFANRISDKYVPPRAIVRDTDGNVYIGWEDYETTSDIYVQKTNASGVPQWPLEGVLVSNGAIEQYEARLILDGLGGIFVTWDDYDGVPDEIRANHVNSSGVVSMSTNLNPTPGSTNGAFGTKPIGINSDVILLTYVENDPIVSFNLRLQKLMKYFQISGLPAGVDVLNGSDVSLKQGSAEGSRSSTESVRLKDTSDNLVIADTTANFTSTVDLNWSISADSNLADKKAFVHNLVGSPGAASSYTLYVPKGADDNSVYVCPGASSLATVTTSCAGGSRKVEADTDVEIVTINSQAYWKITGLTGTGGVSYAYVPPAGGGGTGGGGSTPPAAPSQEDDEVVEFTLSVISETDESGNDTTTIVWDPLPADLLQDNDAVIDLTITDQQEDQLFVVENLPENTTQYTLTSQQENLLEEDIQYTVDVEAEERTSGRVLAVATTKFTYTTALANVGNTPIRLETTSAPNPASSDTSINTFTTPQVFIPIFAGFVTSILAAFIINPGLLKPSNLGVLLGIWLTRKRKYWGIIYDIDGAKVIPFAQIKLETTDGRTIMETVSDLEGRYALLPDTSGQFILKVEAGGYQDYSKQVSINTTATEILLDAGMTKVKAHINIFNRLRYYFIAEIISMLRAVLALMMVAGLVYTIIVTLDNPILANFGILFAYFILTLISLRPLVAGISAQPGQVLETVSRTPLAGVTVRVYLGTELLDIGLTNKQGRLKLKVQPGMYNLHLSKAGYELDGQNATLEQRGLLHLVKVRTNQGGYFDRPILMHALQAHSDSKSALSSPFN